MKASELILQLQKIIDEYGDKEVNIDDKRCIGAVSQIDSVNFNDKYILDGIVLGEKR